MLRSIAIFSLVLVYVVNYAEPVPIPGINLHLGGGGKADGKLNEKGSESTEKESSKLGLGSIIGKIVSLPITLPISAVKLPIKLSKFGLGFAWSSAKNGVKGITNGALKINSINADIVNGIVNVIKAVLGKIIRLITSTNIFGIKIGVNGAAWITGRLDAVAGGILDLISWSLGQAAKVADGTYNLLHIRQILNLPVLKQIVDGLKHINQWNMNTIYKNCLDLMEFIQSIIEEHEDFFKPIFQNAYNIISAITKAVQQIQGGGENSNMNTALGKMSLKFLGPLKALCWQMSGLGNNTVGKGSLGALIDLFEASGSSDENAKGSFSGSEEINGISELFKGIPQQFPSSSSSSSLEIEGESGDSTGVGGILSGSLGGSEEGSDDNGDSGTGDEGTSESSGGESSTDVSEESESSSSGSQGITESSEMATGKSEEASSDSESFGTSDEGSSESSGGELSPDVGEESESSSSGSQGITEGDEMTSDSFGATTEISDGGGSTGDGTEKSYKDEEIPKEDESSSDGADIF